MKAFERAKKIPFLRKRIEESNLGSFSGLQDLTKLPFTVKKDIADSFPFGALAVPISEVARVHTSSGSTNKPINTFYTKNDLNIWSDLIARNLIAIGCTKGDIFQNTASQGMFTGGLGYIQGAEKIGMMVVPLGSANPEKQLETMGNFGVTVFHSIPSFALRMVEILEEKGGRDKLKLRLAMLGAEPWTTETRAKIEDGLGLEAFNNYGIAEVGGPGVAVECRCKSGLHVWEDHFLPEIIDPKTGEVLEAEEEGELVITPLSREAMPLLRYRTGDITRMLEGECDCGRTHRRIDWMRGRIDDMIKIRGVGIYPSNIERVLAAHREFNGNFLIVLSGVDAMTVKVEVTNGYWKDQAAVSALASTLTEEIKHATLVRCKVEILQQGTLPRAEGKAKRVLDMRRLL